MKRVLLVLLIIINICIISTSSFAANLEDEFNVYAKSEVTIKDAVVAKKDESTGDYVAKMADGVIVKARPKGTIPDTIQLMVMPIKKNINKEWEWLQSITKTLGVNKSAYDIFFVNSKGKRVNTSAGCEISVISTERRQDVHVFYIDNDGKKSELKSRIENYAVKFNMVRNGFYTLLVKSKNSDKEFDFIKDKDKFDKDEGGKGEDGKDSEDSENEDDEEIDDEDDAGKDKDKEDSSDDENYDDMLDGYQSEVDDVTDEESEINWVIIVIILVLITVILVVLILFKRKKDSE